MVDPAIEQARERPQRRAPASLVDGLDITDGQDSYRLAQATAGNGVTPLT